MSKSIQERVKHLENVVKSCCNRFFKLKEQVDTLETTVEDLTTDISIALDLKANLAGAIFTGNIAAPNFKSVGLQSLTEVVWTGTTAPSGTADLFYQWQRNGNQVTVTFAGIYSVAGSALTQVRFPLPTDLPTPVRPIGFPVSAGTKYYIGSGHLTNALTLISTATTNMYMICDNIDTSKFNVILGGSSASHLAFYGTISYFTS